MKYKNAWIPFFVKKCNKTVELNPITGMIRYKKNGEIFYPNAMRDDSGYFMLTINRKRVNLHDIFCRCFHGPPPSKRHKADHINNNREDNRPWNLRWADPRENALNRKPSETATSKYRGVSWRAERSNWKATAHDPEETLGKGKRVHCGTFKTDIEAAEAVDKKMIEIGYEEEFLNKNMFNLEKEEALTSPDKYLKKEEIDKNGVWKSVNLPERAIEVSNKGVVKYTHKKTGQTIYSKGSKKQGEKHSYFRIKFDGKHYGVHNLVGAGFDLLDLEDSEHVIDHIDNNTLNNHLSNLRKATKSENSRNRKKRDKRITLQELAETYLKEHETSI